MSNEEIIIDYVVRYLDQHGKLDDLDLAVLYTTLVTAQKAIAPMVSYERDRVIKDIFCEEEKDA